MLREVKAVKKVTAQESFNEQIEKLLQTNKKVQ